MTCPRGAFFCLAPPTFPMAIVILGGVLSLTALNLLARPTFALRFGHSCHLSV